MHIFSPVQQFLLTWLLFLVTGWATLNALSYVGELLSILITAGLIAFYLTMLLLLLQPFLPRNVAAVLVYLVTGFVVVIIGVTLVPPVFNQARLFVTNLPSLVDSAQDQLTSFQTWCAAQFAI